MKWKAKITCQTLPLGYTVLAVPAMCTEQEAFNALAREAQTIAPTDGSATIELFRYGELVRSTTVAPR